MGGNTDAPLKKYGMMQVVSVRPRMAMRDDGAQHEKMDHDKMDHGSMDHDSVDRSKMDHSRKDHGGKH